MLAYVVAAITNDDKVGFLNMSSSLDAPQMHPLPEWHLMYPFAQATIWEPPISSLFLSPLATSAQPPSPVEATL